MKKIFCIFCLFINLNVCFAADKSFEKADFPIEVQKAIDEVLSATTNLQKPKLEQLNFLVGFVHAQKYAPDTTVALKERDEGDGIFYYNDVNFSLKDFIDYSLNPALPIESIYPNSVRRGFWREDSRLWQDYSKIQQLQLPIKEVFFTSGIESEEITPDTTSGCYYNYELKRTIVIMPDPVNGKTAIVSGSMQVQPSSIGLKGMVLGQDASWDYLYTDVVGSNLSMVGWAKTQVYAAANVNVWVERDGKLTLSVFKWLKAGWSGMNVVKDTHISAGVQRYLAGFKQVLQHKNRPSPQDIIAQYTSLKSQNEQELDAKLSAHSQYLAELAKKHEVKNDDYLKLLQDNKYGHNLKKEYKISELIKLYMKDRIK